MTQIISEATALARARAVKKTFPKGRITVAQARQMVMAMADSQVGYKSPSYNRALYTNGNRWVTKWNGRNVSYCAMGATWVFEQCFGTAATIAGIGYQNANPNWPPCGWTATWLWHDWFRAKGRWVGMEAAQTGDIHLQSWGRTTNSTDHVEIVSGPYRKSDDRVPCIGFNTSVSNVTAGSGVARVIRPRWSTVGVYRPDWEALLAVYNADKAAPKPKPAPEKPAPEEEFMTDAQYKKLEKDIADLRALLITRTTVDVSEGTAKNMNTGRTGPQPLGWFVGVIGNRTGRSDIRIAAMSRDFPTYPDRVWRVGLPDGKGGTVQAQSYLRGGNAKAQNASAAARAGLELQTEIAEAHSAALAQAATEVVAAVQSSDPANPEAIEQAVHEALVKALKGPLEAKVTFEVEEAGDIEEVKATATEDPVGDED